MIPCPPPATAPDSVLGALIGIVDEAAAQEEEETDSSTVVAPTDVQVTLNNRLSGAPKRYATIMKKFLIFRGTPIPYSVDDILRGFVPDDELLKITPEEVKEFLSEKAYGIRDPGNSDLPTSCRANTLVVYKTAISFFVPRQTQPWDNITRIGNPTRCAQVNGVVKKVQKFEVRKQGADPQSRRPLEYAEFIQILELLKINAHNTTAASQMTKKVLKTLSLITLQWYTISRIDDMYYFRTDDLTNNPSIQFALCCQLRWSKNIM